MFSIDYAMIPGLPKFSVIIQCYYTLWKIIENVYFLFALLTCTACLDVKININSYFLACVMTIQIQDSTNRHFLHSITLKVELHPKPKLSIFCALSQSYHFFEEKQIMKASWRKFSDKLKNCIKILGQRFLRFWSKHYFACFDYLLKKNFNDFEILSFGYLSPLSMFCALSQNYEHLFWKIR